jgi:hypothetical protein
VRKMEQVLAAIDKPSLGDVPTSSVAEPEVEALDDVHQLLHKRGDKGVSFFY